MSLSPPSATDSPPGTIPATITFAQPRQTRPSIATSRSVPDISTFVDRIRAGRNNGAIGSPVKNKTIIGCNRRSVCAKAKEAIGSWQEGGQARAASSRKSPGMSSSPGSRTPCLTTWKSITPTRRCAMIPHAAAVGLESHFHATALQRAQHGCQFGRARAVDDGAEGGNAANDASTRASTSPLPRSA